MAEIAPRLLDLLEDQYRRDGVQMPDPVRKELSEAAEVGMQWRDFQRVYANTSEHFVDPECSSPTSSVPMSYSSKVTAKKMGVGERAVQRRAERGTLPATRQGRTWHFDAAAIDQLVKGLT